MTCSGTVSAPRSNGYCAKPALLPHHQQWGLGPSLGHFVPEQLIGALPCSFSKG